MLKVVNDTHCSLVHRLWLLAVSLSFFTSCYQYANFAAAALELVPSVLFAVDSSQVLLQWMIIPYLSSVLCYCGCFLLLSKIDDLRRLLAKLSWAVFVASAAFLLYPLKFSYALPPLDNWLLELAFSLLHAVDQPFNQAPSLHVIFAVIFCSEIAKVTNSWLLRLVGRAWLMLVILATWFTFQHHSIDIISGVAVGVAINLLLKKSVHYCASGYLMASALCGLAMHYLYDKAWLGALLMGYLAVSWLAISMLYHLNKPEWLGKKSGKIGWVKSCLFAPYLLGYQLTWLLNNRYFPEAQRLTKVTAQLWLGPKLKPQLLALLPENVWVFDLSAELDEQPALRAGRYMNFALLDLQAPSSEQLVAILNKLWQQLERQGDHSDAVYLHCAMGYSRCNLVACLYLMLKNNYSAGQAREYLSSLGGEVKLGPQYLSDSQLIEIAAQCRRVIVGFKSAAK